MKLKKKWIKLNKKDIESIKKFSQAGKSCALIDTPKIEEYINQKYKLGDGRLIGIDLIDKFIVMEVKLS